MGAAGFRGAVCQPCRAFSPEVAVAIGVPIFFNAQSDKAEERPNVDNCFPCQATGSVPCRFCENGSGTITVTLGDGTTEETECLNCEGRGAMTAPRAVGRGCSRGISPAACTPTTTERPTSLGRGSPW